MSNDLNEESLLSLLTTIREQPSLYMRPTQLAISEEGLARMKVLCANDPELRKLVLAEFPQLEGVI